MKTSHTPGPWHVGMRQAERIIYDAKGNAVANATVYHGKTDRDEVLENARLIAAAPELLAALEMYEKALNERDDSFLPHGQFQTASIRARAAIAKAKGEA